MITYKVQKTRNPRNPDVDYFHGVAVKTSELDFEKLAKRINNSTTVTTADCYAVLKSMKENIIEALIEGQVVALEDLGRFQVSLQGKCYPQEVMKAEDFSPSAQVKSYSYSKQVVSVVSVTASLAGWCLCFVVYDSGITGKVAKL